MRWNLAMLSEYSNGKIINGNGEESIEGVSIDSKKVSKGDFFIALKGERTDGHNFIKEAFDKGASACLAKKGKYDYSTLKTGQSIIEVDDTLQALKQIAKKHLENSAAYVIGVTGSVGKTTTKDMIAEVISTKYSVLKTRGNLNTDIGLPMSLFHLDKTHDAVVLEMGMNSRGEIAELCRIAPPEIAVITSVAEAHLESLKTLDNIASAKGEILEGMTPRGVAILNADDERVKSLAAKAPGEVIMYGSGSDADIKINDYWYHSMRAKCKLDYAGEEVVLSLDFPGKHNLLNALAAIAVGIVMDIELEECVKVLERFYPTDMRNQIFTGNNDLVVINDAYNANVKSTKAALDVLSEVASHRRIAILGDMYELGEYANEAHREIGRYAREKEIDLLIGVGEKAKLTCEEAINSGMCSDNVYYYKNKLNLIEDVNLFLRANDTVLIKGSRGMELEDVVDAIID